MEEIIKKAQKLLQENKPLLADDMLRKALKNYNDDELGIYASQLYALRGTCAFYMSNMEYDVNMQVIGRRGEYVAVEIIP